MGRGGAGEGEIRPASRVARRERGGMGEDGIRPASTGTQRAGAAERAGDANRATRVGSVPQAGEVRPNGWKTEQVRYRILFCAVITVISDIVIIISEYDVRNLTESKSLAACMPDIFLIFPISQTKIMVHDYLKVPQQNPTSKLIRI